MIQDKNIKISIVITARNYSPFLKECIESCLNQTIKPLEVIYSDDYSTDDSVNVAKSCGVKVVEQKSHVGVVVARNAGVKATKGNVLVHVDGDDMLSPDYLEKCLEVFDETTPFVYCAAQAFGSFETFWKVYSWDTLFLWNRNFVNTSAMIWKDAFLRAGGWQETKENTMWDWSLALRLSRLGTPKKSSAVLLYRQHPDSWSRKKGKEKDNLLLSLTEKIRRELVTVTVGLVYSGRIDGFLNFWMDVLVRDIQHLNNKVQLIVINNSEEDLSYLKEYSESFSEIKIITGSGKLSWSSEVDRRNKVCELLSECYNRIIENANGDLIHLREDDIIPLEGSFEKIFDFITEGIPVKPAVAGLYLNRNPNYRKVIGGNFNEDKLERTQDFDKVPSKQPFLIDFTGTGFLIFWKDLCPKFSPYVNKIQAHDWAWGLKMKSLKRDLWMVPEAKCKHYQNKSYFIVPSDDVDILPKSTFTKKTNLRKIKLTPLK